MNDNRLLKYARLTLNSKKKRIRKKAFHKLVILCGYDKEGLANYAKVANYLLPTRKK